MKDFENTLNKYCNLSKSRDNKSKKQYNSQSNLIKKNQSEFQNVLQKQPDSKVTVNYYTKRPNNSNYSNAINLSYRFTNDKEYIKP